MSVQRDLETAAADRSARSLVVWIGSGALRQLWSGQGWKNLPFQQIQASHEAAGLLECWHVGVLEWISPPASAFPYPSNFTMPAKRTAARKDSSLTANIGLEAKLWLTADKLRNNMDAAEYRWEESNATTRRIAVMNLALIGTEADFGLEHADTFHPDLRPDHHADLVLANPPFKDSDWFHKDDDVRWQFGAPPTDNANFARVQHFILHLSPRGLAGLMLANGSMSSYQSGESRGAASRSLLRGLEKKRAERERRSKRAIRNCGVTARAGNTFTGNRIRSDDNASGLLRFAPAPVVGILNRPTKRLPLRNPATFAGFAPAQPIDDGQIDLIATIPFQDTHRNQVRRKMTTRNLPWNPSTSERISDGPKSFEREDGYGAERHRLPTEGECRVRAGERINIRNPSEIDSAYDRRYLSLKSSEGCTPTLHFENDPASNVGPIVTIRVPFEP